MSEPTMDVLAVLDREIRDENVPGHIATQLAEARAAVAELVEADREYDETMEWHAKAVAYCDHFDPEQGLAARALKAARARRAAALARFGGE